MLPADAAYFHAHWRREAPTRTNPANVPRDKVNQTLGEGLNKTGAGNYVILDA